MPGSELVQSVQRSVKLLQIVSSRPEGISLRELADESGLQKSTRKMLKKQDSKA